MCQNTSHCRKLLSVQLFEFYSEHCAALSVTGGRKYHSRFMQVLPGGCFKGYAIQSVLLSSAQEWVLHCAIAIKNAFQWNALTKEFPDAYIIVSDLEKVHRPNQNTSKREEIQTLSLTQDCL